MGAHHAAGVARGGSIRLHRARGGERRCRTRPVLHLRRNLPGAARPRPGGVPQSIACPEEAAVQTSITCPTTGASLDFELPGDEATLANYWQGDLRVACPVCEAIHSVAYRSA